MFSMNMKQAGRGFLVLNVIRVFNIIALLDVVAASWIMLVMTVKTSNVSLFSRIPPPPFLFHTY